MTAHTSALALATLVFVTSTLSAADKKASRLPRVLLIGDSISIGYTKPVVKLLAGKADVQRVSGNAGHTGMGLDGLPKWLAPEAGKWDVIHFNWGLWDLCYRDPTSKNQGRRDKLKGEVTHTVEQYAANLTKIVATLRSTGAELIFATTTPVPPGEAGRKVGDDVRYNEAALHVMRRDGVAIDDLHGLIKDRMKELATRPGNVHFKKEGSQVLAEQVARSIERSLRQRFAAKRTKGQPKTIWAPSRRIQFKKIGDVELSLHVFEPDGHLASDRRPAIVFFFGGSWVGGSPSQFYPHCEYLACRGMVAISAEYRVKKQHGTTPFECVKDGKSAIRYVRTHAAELGIDPKRIAAGGGSAGGHVAAATGTVEGLDEDADRSVSARPNALVLYNPVYDNGPGSWGYDRVRDRYLEISPKHNIRKGMPPAIAFFGSKDSLISVSDAESFQSKMRQVESRSDLHIYDGRKHGFFNHGRGDGNDYKDTVRAMDAFLASLGYLEGRPTIALAPSKRGAE
jgi:acetyl esterase/lipase